MMKKQNNIKNKLKRAEMALIIDKLIVEIADVKTELKQLTKQLKETIQKFTPIDIIESKIPNYQINYTFDTQQLCLIEEFFKQHLDASSCLISCPCPKHQVFLGQSYTYNE